MEGGVSSESNLTDLSLVPEAGIIPRSIHQIFQALDELQTEYSIRVSFLELYNEELIDLLGVGENLKLFESPRGITVAGLEEVPVTNSRDIFKILERGWKKRATAETNLNKNSRFENHHILTPTEKFYFFEM